MNIVELAASKALAEGAQTITQIEIEVGSLAGVLVDSLDFCFEAAARNTLAQGADLKIVEVPAQGHCPHCEKRYTVESLLDECPDCGGFLHVVQGREMRVVSIVVDE